MFCVHVCSNVDWSIKKHKPCSIIHPILYIHTAQGIILIKTLHSISSISSNYPYLQLMGKDVSTTSDCIGADVDAAVAKMQDGDVLMLENARFYKEEEKNGADFAEKLAKNASIFVNDAFGKFRGLVLYTVSIVVIFRIEWCTRKQALIFFYHTQ